MAAELIFKLKRKLIIQKFLAFLLLLVFSISIAPKNYFHTIIADHKDVSYCNDAHKSTNCVHQQGVNCHFDELVVTVPYLFQPQQIAFLPHRFYIEISSAYISSFLQYNAIAKENKGPPFV